MKTHYEEERTDITLGDLLIAINDAAFEVFPDSSLSYLLASLALEKILKKGTTKEKSSPHDEGITLH